MLEVTELSSRNRRTIVSSSSSSSGPAKLGVTTSQLGHRSSLLSLNSFPLVLMAILYTLQVAHAQVVNGQYFTKGLSVVNSPLPNQQFNANGNIPISIEVTGDGKLPMSASTPSQSSALPTAFNFLTLFLTSASHDLNATISSDNSLLANEQGSSVKHLTFAIPSCLPGGDYHVTLYEQSKFNDEEHFIITPIPVVIQNPGSSTSMNCPDLVFNDYDANTQASTPLASSPFTNSNSTLQMSAGSAATRGADVMATLTLSAGAITTVTLVPSYPAGGAQQTSQAVLSPVNAGTTNTPTLFALSSYFFVSLVALGLSQGWDWPP